MLPGKECVVIVRAGASTPLREAGSVQTRTAMAAITSSARGLLFLNDLEDIGEASRQEVPADAVQVARFQMVDSNLGMPARHRGAGSRRTDAVAATLELGRRCRPGRDAMWTYTNEGTSNLEARLRRCVHGAVERPDSCRA
jgi:hypothetical protein